ncbi:hypothetical protein H0Z60_10210 [Ectothiorhodospiraceae bacterium WFHF3C12]|nr:hypothetical protein [Ectothiorhodospiraceae bacterium WFHF3C12]
MWDKLMGLVKDAAPTLAGVAGTALTGGNPAGGAVLSSLARQLTGDGKDADLDQVAEQILADPEKLQEFRLRARKLDLKELELRTQDVQHARETHKDSQAPAIISVLVIVAFIGAVGTVMSVQIPEGSRNLAYLLLGHVAGAFSTVLAYWLGSSKGSKDKDRMMSAYADAARRDQQARATTKGG